MLVARRSLDVVVVVAVTFLLAGCQSLPWSSGGMGAQPLKPVTEPAGSADDVPVGGGQVTPASWTLKAPDADSDWLAGTHVVAIVNGDPIFASEILSRQSQVLAQARQQLPAAQYKALQEQLIRRQLQGYIDRRLMSQAMWNDLDQERKDFLDTQLAKMFTSQEVPRLLAENQLQSVVGLTRKLAEQGQTLEVLKEDFQQQQLAMEYLRQAARARTQFSPSEMMAWYRKNSDRFETRARVKWRQILVTISKHDGRDPALTVIEAARRRLAAGEDFAAVARDLSDGPAAGDGGLWDWTDRESFKDERIARTLFGLPVGTPSRIYEGDGFFQLVTTVEREDGGPRPFDEVQDQVEQALAEADRVTEMERVVKELREGAEIVSVFDHQPAGTQQTGWQHKQKQDQGIDQ